MSSSSLDRTHFPSSLARLYDWLNGTASVSTIAAVQATGSVTFSANPSANATVTFGGTAVTFVASGATGNQVNIGANLAATMTALAAFANASADTNISKASYVASATALAVTYKVGGTVGNAFTLAAASAATVSGATLAGGVVNAKQAAFGHYETAYISTGSGRADYVTIGTSPVVKIGQRKLFTFATETSGADSIVFTDPTSFSKAALTVSAASLNAVNDYLLVEWRGSKWEVIASATGVVTAS